MPAYGELAHGAGHAPQAAAAGWKECHVAGTEPALGTVIIGDEDLAGNHVHGFLDAVGARALGLPFGRPRHHDRGAVGAAGKLPGACLGVPSTIQRGSMGAGSRATVEGSAITICMTAPAFQRPPLCRKGLPSR